MISLITTYGYVVVYLVSIFEGESVLILGGFAVHEGYLSISPLFLAAFAGAITGDLGWFLLGRYKGHTLIEKWPWLKRWSTRPLKAIHAKPACMAFGLRFMYGFRHVIPFGLGMSSLPIRTFILWNSLAAAVWTLLIGSLGFLFGDILELFLGHIKKYEFGIIIVAILLIASINAIGNMVKFFLNKYIEGKSK